MTNFVKYLTVGAAALCVSLAGSPASASNVVAALPGGPFTAANPIAAIPVSGLTGVDTHDFTFSWDDVETTATLTTDSTSKVSQYQLYSGNPGSGTFLGESNQSINPTITFNVLRGDYYVEVTPSEVIGNTGGGIAAPAPEPAAWAMMLVGFGGLGVAMRSRRRVALAPARS
jgi:hypothetical protein